MREFRTDLRHWPRTRGGEPIFRTANEAIFYAQLASNGADTIKEMKSLRARAHRKLRRLRKNKDANLDGLFNYAVKAQFFRECYEEIQRINAEDK